jgi:hypothetical protein
MARNFEGNAVPKPRGFGFWSRDGSTKYVINEVQSGRVDLTNIASLVLVTYVLFS